MKQSLIEVEAAYQHEAEADIAAVLNEYDRNERELTERARDFMADRGLPREQLSRIKRGLAKEKGLPIGEDALDYVMGQIIEVLMHSPNVEEVFGEDHDIKRCARPVLKKHLTLEEEIQEQARARVRNLTEGTTAWETEYQRAMAALRRAKGVGNN